MSTFKIPYCKLCGGSIDGQQLAIEIKGLTASYPEGSENILEGVDLEIKGGQRVALLGPNGAGKSSLLKTLVGVINVYSGTVRIFGHPVGKCRHQVTYLPQRSDIDWGFPISVYNLVLTGSYIHLGWFRKPKAEHKLKAFEAIRLMRLEEVKDRQIGKLSVGQQRRVLIARSLVHDAQLFLLDEPFNAVDKETKEVMKHAFQAIKEQGKTVLVATHDLGSMEEYYDAAIEIKEGKIIGKIDYNNGKHKDGLDH